MSAEEEPRRTDLPAVMQIEALVSWTSKTVTTRSTTRPVRYVPHDEWRLGCTLIAPTAIRVVRMFRLDGRTLWGFEGTPASLTATLIADFFPSDWTTSDEVQVNFGQSRRALVSDHTLKLDPRNAVEITLPATVRTGEPFEIARLPTHRITLSALALVETDTEPRRSNRWVVRPDVVRNLPAAFAALAEGPQTGVLPEPAGS